MNIILKKIQFVYKKIKLKQRSPEALASGLHLKFMKKIKKTLSNLPSSTKNPILRCTQLIAFGFALRLTPKPCSP